MYKYFLGALRPQQNTDNFFVKPQFEIIDGHLRSVENRRDEFPNSGTIFLNTTRSTGSGDEYRDRLFKFRIDFQQPKYKSPTFEPSYENSCAYTMQYEDIDQLKNDEIVEIIPCEIPIEKVIAEQANRTFKIDHCPSKNILLYIGEYCYGPLVCINKGKSETNELYTVNIFSESNCINRYKRSDLETIINEGYFSLFQQNKLWFIYKLETLMERAYIDQVDFIDDSSLLKIFERMLNESNTINEIKAYSHDFFEQIQRISNSFHDIDTTMKYSRVDRIVQMIKSTDRISEYLTKVTYQFFTDNEKAEEFKTQFLIDHPEYFETIAKKDSKYTEQLELLVHELAIKESEITQKREALDNLQKKLEQNEILFKQLTEDVMNSKKKELYELEKEINNKNVEISGLDYTEKRLRTTISTAQENLDSINRDIDTKICEWIQKNRENEIVDLLFREMNMPLDKPMALKVYSQNDLMETKNAQDLVLFLSSFFKEAGRNVSIDDIYNYLISITQNFITVFAGEPGSGKTSLCKLLAKGLGLYTNRFAEISVERGWTSSKDLIGYYNPITKHIEKTQPAFSSCLEIMNEEVESNINPIPYIALLDEANLSPIEYYWSNFNHFNDDRNDKKIDYGNGHSVKIGSGLRFLATINYDHTTEVLSPRFLDRAWVILMESISLGDIIEIINADENKVKNNQRIIDLATLENYFGDTSGKEVSQLTKKRLMLILETFRDIGGHVLSNRSVKAIVNYCSVAEMYMSKESALDYAVSQKLLPLINGNDEKYQGFLEELQKICRDNQLDRCCKIINNILRKSDHLFYNYFNA